jgi:TrmH family RNA methyltransferase
MGEKLVKEFLKKPNFEILAEVIGPDHRPLLEGREFDRTPKYQLTKDLFDEVDVVGTHFNMLLLKAPEVPMETLSEPHGLELVLPLGDPGNLGACLRSAYAFGVKKVWLTEEASHPFHPKAIKASAGASLHLKLSRTEKLANVISNAKKAFVLDQNGTNISKFKFPKDLYLFIGEEGPGLPAHKLLVLSIPTQGVESLNATVATSIACYQYSQS